MADEMTTAALASLMTRHEAELLSAWKSALAAAGATGGGRIKDAELTTQCRDVLGALTEALKTSDGARGQGADARNAAFAPVRELLAAISRSRAAQGFSPSETASFVFSFKQPLFARLRTEFANDAGALADANWQATELLDELGLYTMEVHQKSREEVVSRQQDEITELSTPVVKLWDGILALPLIGTLDSSRTQVVMESLLQAIVDQEAEIAIIDITGVPTVDTLVAQHLLKTIAAARLMGADCIVSGIRPQIAQTMVHLGVELNVVSKASLADALALALFRTGRTVVRTPNAASAAASSKV